MKRLPVYMLVALLLGCAGGGVKPNSDSGPDDTSRNNVPDAGPGEDTDGPDDPDSPPDGPFDGHPPMTVIQEGSDGLLLHGLVLTVDGPMENGQVLVSGRDIVCVATDCTDDPAASNARWIATGGIISPGLIDAHNHLPYNFLPEWEPPGGTLYENRYVWADDPTYEAHIAPFSTHRSSGSHYCPAAKWGEVRSLIHGTTTMQGQSANQKCIQYGVRNADHEQGLQHDHMRTMIGSPREVTDDMAESFLDSINDLERPTTRIAIHMQEGYAGSNILLEFDSWAGRDTRDNRHMGISLLYQETSVLIHSISLTDAQLDEVAQTGSKVVWSPSSNMVLYGRTAPISKILERNITTGIGPDWTLSGEDNMLGELRYARDYAVQNGVAALTPEKLWRMATDEGAVVVGLDGFVGRIEVGYRADLAVFSRLDEDPYVSVFENDAPDVQLVMIDGEAFFGPGHLRETVGRNVGCEPIDVCGESKFVCVKDPEVDAGHEDLADVRQRLVDILEGNGYPPEEQYGRGDELLELFECN